MSLVSNQFHTFNAPELLEITSGTTFAQTQKKQLIGQNNRANVLRACHRGKDSIGKLESAAQREFEQDCFVSDCFFV